MSMTDTKESFAEQKKNNLVLKKLKMEQEQIVLGVIERLLILFIFGQGGGYCY